MLILMHRFHKLLVCTVVLVGVFGSFALRSSVVASGQPVEKSKNHDSESWFTPKS